MRVAQTVAILASTALAVGCATAVAVSRGYNINTRDISCEEANRYVQESIGDMKMTITEFRKARPGAPGYAKAEREDSRGGLSGRVDIRCDEQGVHILPDESGFSTSRDFERGLFLSIAGRADLVVEREDRYSTGVLHKRQPHAGATAASGSGPPASGADAKEASASDGGVEVQVEPIRGFATVLDFEANVSAADILPIKVTVANRTSRVYDFDPRNVVLRISGSREAAEPLSAAQTVERLRTRAGSSEGSTRSGDLGDVAAATRIIPERELAGARLQPGRSITGYLYFPDGEYDRARITMIDVATGETEGFLVEF